MRTPRILGRVSWLVLFVFALTACAPSAPPAPTSAPAKPAEATKPTAAAAKPAEAKTGEALKPSAPAVPTAQAGAAAAGPEAKPAPTAAPVAGGGAGKTLVIAGPATLSGLDFEYVIERGSIQTDISLFDNLAAYKKVQNKDGLWQLDVNQFEPRLAESWTVSPDGKTWTFKLRQGIKSNFGNEFTADDVMWKWQRLKGLNNRWGFIKKMAQLQDVESIKVIDKYTISFTTMVPNPFFLMVMEVIVTQLVDSVEAKRHATPDDPWAKDWLNRNYAGWGPYTIEKWTPGQETVFVRRPDYPLGGATVDRVIYREVPSSAQRVALLQSGAIDIAEELSFRELQDLKGKPGIKVLSWEGTNMQLLVMNVTVEPFNKKEVRQAISSATPRKEIADAVYLGFSRPLKGITPPNEEFFTDRFWKYDEPNGIARAKELLAQAGLAGGFKATLTYNSGLPTDEQNAILIQTALKQIGVELELAKLAPAQYWQEAVARKAALALNRNTSYLPATALNMVLFYGTGSASNYAKYSNLEFDKLLDDAFTLDNNKRKEVLEKAQQILVEEVPFTALVMPGWHVATRENIDGVTWHPTNLMQWANLRKN